MPIVEITGPELPQEGKDRIVKAITEIIAEEERAAYKVDTTPITVVLFREIPVPDLYIGTKPLPQVLETLPKVDTGYG
jgi:phenylpyruvate tautomerase PptA (4-oxalocrotonate tautomerase family)